MGWGGRREGGSGWGTHVHPWLILVNVWQNPLQYCKVISLQLKKKVSPLAYHLVLSREASNVASFLYALLEIVHTFEL